MVRGFGEMLLYCITRFALLIGFLPLAFIMTLYFAGGPGLFFPLLVAAVVIPGVWLLTRRAPASDLSVKSQLQFTLVSALMWASGLAGFGLGQIFARIPGLPGDRVIELMLFLSFLVPCAFGIRQSWPRRIFFIVLWIAGVAASGIFSLPTC
jgi:hypothetical protein